MLRLIALGIVSAVIMFGFIIGPGLQERQENHNEYLRRKQAQELYGRELDLERKEALQGANIAATASMLTLGVMLAFGSVGIFLYWSANRAHATRDPLVRADTMGRLPVSRMALTDGQYDRVVHRVYELLAEAQVEKAIHQPHQTPAHLSYSGNGKIIDMPAAEPVQVIDTPQKELPEAPKPRQGETLLQCYRRNGIIDRSGDSLHIGHNVETGTPVYLELEQWGGKAIGGVSRTGKTNRVVYYTCQGALCGWRTTVCDPDGPDTNGRGGKKDALLRKLQPLVEAGLITKTAVEPAEIIAAIDNTHKMLEARRAGKGPNWHHLLIIDEFTNLVIGGHIPDDTLDQLAVLSLRGAGYGLHSLFVGHDWAAAASGNTKRGGLLKRIMTQTSSHRMSIDGARILASGRRDAQQLIAELPDYHSVYIDAAGAAVVDTPYMTPEDIRYAAEHAGTWRSRKQPQQTISEVDNSALLSRFYRETFDDDHTPVDDEKSDFDDRETFVVITPGATKTDSSSKNAVSVSPVEIAKIAQMLQSSSPSTVAKSLDGYNGRNYDEYKAKVDLVRSMLAGAGTA